ncbi:MAG: hypothetical protein O7F09_02465, partial [Chloroflexi bacterium]|nr:hypothetical protein [Chloroflexota bacterium]
MASEQVRVLANGRGVLAQREHPPAFTQPGNYEPKRPVGLRLGEQGPELSQRALPARAAAAT